MELENKFSEHQGSSCSTNMSCELISVANRNDNLRNVRTKDHSCVGGNINYLYDCPNIVSSDSSRISNCVPPRIKKLVDC